MTENRILYEFVKNTHERVRVEFGKYNKFDLVGVRVYFLANVEKNEWRPTRKGITMKAELLPELKKGIDKAAREWNKAK